MFPGVICTFLKNGPLCPSRKIKLALQLTRQGKHNEALQLLLDPQTWRGLNSRQYPIWALAVWKVFDFVAERR